MIEKKDQERMLDFFVSRLESSYGSVIPQSKEILPGIVSEYINLNNNYIIIMVDKEYPKKKIGRHYSESRLKELYERAKKQFSEVGFAFYLDGETFFRKMEARENYDDRIISRLKTQNSDILNSIATFRPEEQFVFKERGGKMQYFNPSDLGIDALLTFQFHQLISNYDGRQTIEGITLKPRIYVHDHAWTKRDEYTGPLILQNGLLVPKPVLDG